uniref:Protein tyrosine phosphatase domain-containing protein 1 n=1 Tax=Kryptolebias marmoratus TaxID=37003 RepID=A0A3Q3EVA4_KRYMA
GHLRVLSVIIIYFSTTRSCTNTRVPTAKYTKMGETLRHVIPGHMQCSMTCGGKACKYENPSRWSDEEQAIKGLYSSWITDNLLAMARPSTEIIEKYNIIQQFQRCALKTVINLQRPGEHASCGKPLEQESGFTYRPEMFMEAGIYYYNFGWKDYGVASLTTILDMVKVMSFAVQEGKIAVHCHAGLGRTGVLFACYLVFTTRMNADQAILFVRAKRPNSIQTRGQLLCVREFAQFLVPLRSVFSCAEPKTSAVTLSQYLIRQRHLLHGYEARRMKNVPKIVQLVCRLLLNIAANRQEVIKEQRLEIPDLTAEVEKTVSQQALQQLGKEMIGKGIPVLSSLHALSPPPLHWDHPLASDNELDPLWRQQNLESSQKSSLSNNRSLSDSLLHKYGQLQHQEGNLKNDKPFLSHSNLTACNSPSWWYLCPQDILSSIQDPKMETNPGTRCSFFQKSLKKQQHSLTLDLSEHGRKALFNAIPSMLLKSSEKRVDVGTNRREATELPYTALHFELSSESRRVLVARALAMDLKDMTLSSKVTWWQTELNSREGTWERLCTEKDPLVLSCLLWSWLEQLKDPVITQDDVQTLSEKNINPQNVLNSLDKGHSFTLLCILDCAAHLLPVPEEVVTMFLNQAIKVFTKNVSLYRTLKSVLTHLLYELRDKAENS